MRAISGTNWGGNKVTLLTIYKSFILSKLDYCSFIYTDLSKTLSKRLDTIQYKSLLLATGGLKGTSLKALLSECGEVSLHLRRKKLLVSYLLKINANKRNLASSVIEDVKFYQLELNSKSKYNLIINEFFNKTNIYTQESTVFFKSTPWFDFSEIVEVTTLPNFDRNNLLVRPLDLTISELTSKYSVVFFVDGSVCEGFKVGAAIYAPALNVELMYKLRNGLSIYYAEAFAILQALKYINEHNINSFCIVSDNTRVLNDIKYLDVNASPHPSIIESICSNILEIINNTRNSNIKLIWMPSHCNNTFMEKVDKLAKYSTTVPDTTEILLYRDEAIGAVEAWIREIWKKEWDQGKICQYQKFFKLQKDVKQYKTRRKNEIIYNRFRMLHTKLNGCMFKLGLHPDGMCSLCNKFDDCCHFIFECQRTEELRKHIKKLYAPGKQWTYSELMADELVLEVIAGFVIKNNVSI